MILAATVCKIEHSFDYTKQSSRYLRNKLCKLACKPIAFCYKPNVTYHTPRIVVIAVALVIMLINCDSINLSDLGGRPINEANEIMQLSKEPQPKAASDTDSPPGNAAVEFDEPKNLGSSDALVDSMGEREAPPGTVQQPITTLFDDLEEDDDFDDDPIDDDAEDFYQTNPLDHKTTSSNDDLAKAVNVKESDFDNEYFVKSQLQSRSKRKRVVNGTSNNRLHARPGRTGELEAASKDKKASSSWQQPVGMQAGQLMAGGLLNCAAMLSRGICIDYQSVEMAFRQARRLLQFQRPEDLNSFEPRESSIDAIGELNEWTTRILAQQYQLTWDEVSFELEQVDLTRTSMWRTCPLLYRQMPNCLALSRYRTHTGQCNNLLSPNLGAYLMPFARMLPAQYNDQVGIARLSSSTSGAPLPPPRVLALNLHPDLWNPSQDFSVLFMAWGQLLNHDMAMAGAKHGKPCCNHKMSSAMMMGRAVGAGLPSRAYRLCLPIAIPPGDPVYGPFGVRCHEFRRTLAALRPGCTLGPRTQLNTVSSYLDASFVYGSSRSLSHKIRTHKRGHLRTWNYFGRLGLKPLMPPQTDNPDQECVGRRDGRYCFLSGDARTNQHLQLAVLHTVHTRQHNRLALALSQLNPHWSDNRLYHEARHIHIAQVQHAVLSEYLPSLLGAELCEQYNLTETPPGLYWDHYDPDIVRQQPGVSQAFAAAAFRQGHSTVPGEVFRFNVLHQPMRMYKLRELFRRPWPLFEPGAMDEFLLGTVDAPAQERDPFLTLELSGHLLQAPGDPIGHDLASINIQRGRDQGVASYNAFRDWCGLGRLESFEDLIGPMSNRTAELMASLYEQVDDIDLFSGGISEFPLEGAQVGPTFACIIGRQFQSLRFGDRFWFESSMGPHAFTPDQLASIKQVPLARILCANSDNVQTIQAHALRLVHPVLNPRLHCNQLPELDLTLWFEQPPPNWQRSGDDF